MKISETVVILVVILLFAFLLLAPHNPNNPHPTRMEGKHGMGI